jgi:hypothetical protein
MVCFDGDKARKALGEDTDFYLDERPIPYQEEWKEMEVYFSDALGGGKKEIPDISANVGKLFLSEKTYLALKDTLYQYGEFLTVKYENRVGYIFNCLTVVDTDNKLNIHDPLNDCFSVVFNSTKTETVNIFKAEIDLDGHFCTNLLKSIAEKKNLTGVTFSTDIGNPFPEELGMRNTH